MMGFGVMRQSNSVPLVEMIKATFGSPIYFIYFGFCQKSEHYIRLNLFSYVRSRNIVLVLSLGVVLQNKSDSGGY